MSNEIEIAPFQMSEEDAAMLQIQAVIEAADEIWLLAMRTEEGTNNVHGQKFQPQKHEIDAAIAQARELSGFVCLGIFDRKPVKDDALFLLGMGGDVAPEGFIAIVLDQEAGEGAEGERA